MLPEVPEAILAAAEFGDEIECVLEEFVEYVKAGNGEVYILRRGVRGKEWKIRAKKGD